MAADCRKIPVNKAVVTLLCWACIVGSALFEGCRTEQPAPPPSDEPAPEEMRRIARAERLLKADDAQTRRQAAVELLAMGSARARDVVSRALNDENPPEHRVNMIEAVAFVEDHQFFETILALVGDPNKGVREAAAQALGRFRQPNEHDRVAHRLRDPATNVDERILLAGSVGLARSRDAIPDLINNLGAPSQELRRVSYEALVKITGRDFPPDLGRWRQWWESNRWKSREELLEDRLQDTDQLIADQKRQISDMTAQIAELVRTASAPQTERAPLLMKGIQSPYAQNRFFAAYSLAALPAEDLKTISLDDADTTAVLTKALKDEDSRVRLNVTILVSKLEGKPKGPLLALALEDPDPEVLLKALGFIRKNDKTGVAKPVVGLLAHKNQEVRETAIAILADQPPQDSAESFIKVLKDPSETVRWLAVESLRKLKATSAVQHLTPLLSDKSDRVREVTALTLGELGDEGAVGVLIDALHDKNDRVRSQASKALQLIATRKPTVARKVSDQLVKDKFYPEALEALKALEDWYGKDPEKADELRALRLERVRVLKLNKDVAGAARALVVLEKETQGDPAVRKELLQSWTELNDLPSLIGAFEVWLNNGDAVKRTAAVELGLATARQLMDKDKKKDALDLLNVLKKTAVELKAEEAVRSITELQKALENKGG